MMRPTLYVREITAVYQSRRDLPPIAPLSTPADAAAYLAPSYTRLAHEHIGALYLDSRHRPIAQRILGRGTVDSSICSPRDVFQCALLVNASAVILAHNHPSGDLTPSPADRRSTDQITAAGQLLGIEVLDHLIFVDAPDPPGYRVYSLRESRLV